LVAAVVQVHDHHNVHFVQERDRRWLVHVLVHNVQVLLRDHLVQIKEITNQVEIVLVGKEELNLHIVHKAVQDLVAEVEHQLVAHHLIVAADVAEMRAEHSEKVEVKRNHRRVKRRYVMTLRICQLHHLVVQFFHVVMVKLKLGYVAALRSQI